MREAKIRVKNDWTSARVKIAKNIVVAALKVLATALAIAAILFSGAAWRLSKGPVSLAVLKPYLQDALTFGGIDYQVQLDDTILSWDGAKRSVDIRAIGVRMLDPTGRHVAQVPEISLGLSVRGLLAGVIAPTRIDLIGLSARFIRDPERGLLLVPTGGAGDQSGALETMIGGLSGGGEAVATRYLRELRIRNADISLEDRVLDLLWTVPDAGLTLWRDNERIRGRLAGNLDFAGELVRVELTGVHDPETGGTELRLEFDELVPALIASRTEKLARVAALKLPVGGNLAMTVDSEGRFGSIDFDIYGGAGFVDLPELYKDPLQVEQLGLRGRLADDWESVRVDELFVDASGATATLRGLVEFSGSDFALAGDGTIRNVSMAALEELWPPSLGSGGHAWVTKNIRKGVVGEGKLRFAVPAGADLKNLSDDVLRLAFSFQGLEVDYFHPLRKATDVTGNGVLTANKLDLTILSGRVGEMQLSDGTVVITELATKIPHADIGIVVRGETANAVALINTPPLNLIGRLGLDASQIGGASATRASFSLPLAQDLDLADVEVVATARLDAAALPNAFRGYDLTDGDLSLRVNNHRLQLSGPAKLNGVPLDLDWRQEFAPDQDIRRQYSLQGVVDDAGRKKLGIDVDDRLSGSIETSLRLTDFGQGRLRGDLELGLEQADLEIRELRWRKPVGTPGRLTSQFEVSNGGDIRVSQFDLAAGNLRALGNAVLRDGEVREIEVSNLELGATKVSLAARPRDGGGMVIAVQGPGLDLRPYLEDKAEFSTGGTPVTLSLQVSNLITDEHQIFENVAAQVSFDGSQFAAINGAGTPLGGEPLHVLLETTENGRSLKVHCDDAGTLARMVGVVENAVGGKLELTALIHDDLPGAPMRGTLLISDFRVTDAPVLANLLSIGSLTGLSDLMRGEGILFQQAKIPFEFRADAIDVIEGIATGPALGITMDGLFWRDEDRMDLGGTIVPSYTLNSILGYIPLLGRILVGREGEGIFGFTYRVEGQTEALEVTVNPLSVLTPGLLRAIFSGRRRSEDNDNLAQDAPEER